MFRQSLYGATLLLSALLAGCYESYEDTSRLALEASSAMTNSRAPHADMRRVLASPAAGVARVSSGPNSEGLAMDRKIAESQHWVFELKSDELEPAWTRHRDICLALANQCDVVDASIASRGSMESARNASLVMRVEHTVFQRFVSEVEGAGARPVATNITREDKTLEWVDLHSRLENAKNLRTRLQAMVNEAGRAHDLSDLLAIESELNRVQSNIDSMESQSRVLALETDKVEMTFRYRSLPETVVRDIWEPVQYAWHNMSNTFSRSVSEVMLFLAASVPWLLIVIPGWFLGRWSLRRVMVKRAAAGHKRSFSREN